MAANSRWKLLAAAAALLVLSGCAATPTPYAPAAGAQDDGYSDSQLTANRYRVGFAGNASTTRETVENYLLFHAAEVTQKAGYRYFLFDTRQTDSKTIYMTDFTGWPGWHGRGFYWHSWPYGPPYGPEETALPVTRYRASAEIVLLTDDEAKREPRALNAAELIEHLRPLVQAPAKAP